MRKTHWEDYIIGVFMGTFCGICGLVGWELHYWLH